MKRIRIRTKKRRPLALLAALLIGLASTACQVAASPTPTPIPHCEEDELIRGRGNYEHGVWDRYRCVHPDTITRNTVCANPKAWYVETTACYDI